jgi:hypothetical protein
MKLNASHDCVRDREKNLMKAHILPRCMVGLVAGLVLSSGLMSRARADDVSAEELAKQFKQLEPWKQSADYSAAGWTTATQVALTVQSAKPEVIEQALEKWAAEIKDEPFNGDFEAESGVFILMRVVFELPEEADPEKAFSFKGWTNSDERLKNGRVNLAWPVTWAGGNPRLVARYEGSQGKPYAALEEYRFMRQRFAFRKLQP